MPRITRELIWPLPHRHKSGLFLAPGEYVADIKPEDGGRIIRRFGKDRGHALRLFTELLEERKRQEQKRENPALLTFLRETFRPAQSDLKSLRFARKRIDAVCCFLEAEQPGLRIQDVRKHHGDALLDFHKHLSPQNEER